MEITSKVCAEFRDREGTVIFRIDEEMRRGIIHDVPETVKEDRLFQMLVKDGSIDVFGSEKKAPENQPNTRANEGKRTEAKSSAAPDQNRSNAGKTEQPKC